ncbi:MAG TPA: hypothetical protein VN817_10315 [Solirubrobacteraceae bacterium]|nr:hypothetical protein [Solirubrobacteraceae bacterium]
MSHKAKKAQSHADESEYAAYFAWLQDHKRLAAWFGFVLVTVSAGLKSVVPQLLPIAAFVYLTALTSVVVDIHRRTDVVRTVFPSHQETAGAFLEEITNAIHAHGPCELDWIGVTMQSAWLTLENAVGRAIADGQISDLHIRLLQSDPDYLRDLLGSDDGLGLLAREQAEYICRFCTRNTRSLNATESTIELAQYAYMPNYHGLLVNKEVLYLATVRWTGEDFSELSVPHEPFERFDRSTDRGRYMIGLYTAWLERGFCTASSVRQFPMTDIKAA